MAGNITSSGKQGNITAKNNGGLWGNNAWIGALTAASSGINGATTAGNTVTPLVAETAGAVANAVAPSAPTTPTVSTWTRPTVNPYDNMYTDLEKKITENYGNQITASTQRKDDALKRVEDDYVKWKAGTTELYDNYKKRLEGDQARDEKSANANYDNSARQNYIAYRQAQKNLPSQLNALGIRGGAAESSLIRLGSNYGTNVANNEMARAQALDSISKQYTSLIADADAEYRKAILARDDAKAQQIASLIDGWSREQSEIEAAKGDALMKAYAQNEENKIAWEAEQDAIAREEAQKQLENQWRTMQWEREGNWHDEDAAIAEEERANAKKQQEYENKTAAEAYRDSLGDKEVERFAAGLAEYEDIGELRKLRDDIKKKHPNWASDQVLYGKVKAIGARIGEIKAAK